MRLTSLDVTEWHTIQSDLHDLIQTYEADAVVDYINKHADRSYKGKALPELLKPVLDKVANFDFADALNYLDEIGG